MTMEGPPSTRSFRPWVWDKPGSVMNFENFESISEEPGSATTTRPPTSRTRGFTTSSGRQTVRWPFHSFSNSRSSIPNYPRRPSNSRSIPHSSGSFPRRAAGSISRSVSSVLGSDIIPDYVVNFMRGETPETLARRHRIPDSPEPGQFQRPRESQLDFIHSASSTPDNSRPGTPRAEREKMLVEERPQPTRSLMTGWRAGVAANMFLAFLILVASVACLALASAQGHMSTWESLLMEGNSTTVEGITRGILAAVNVFAIILIAGANYVVQILNSPTRAEVDNAHSTFKWLDIGTPSLQNMSLISSTRATLSGIMMVFALLSQVIYNSIIITTEHAEKSKSSLNVNGPLLAAITLINVVLILTYAIAVALALTRQVFSPLVTLGDALSSFLADPDVSTQDSCLITKEEIKKGLWGDREGKYWYAKTSRWFNVPSFNRWAIWFMTWIMPVGLAAAALTLGAVKEPKEAFTRFGKATVVYELPAGTSRSGMAVVAALPQLLLGLLYLSSNALLTLFYLSHELSQFTSDLLPLRVSSGQPLGSQTTSLYLTLPRPVSWILFFLVVAMGFLLSQGILLVTVDDIKGTTTGIGFSPLPLLILLVLLVLLGLGIAGLALRQVDPRGSVEGGEPAGNPLALVGGTCSAVLSARCHRVSREGGVETLEVRWGVVREGVGMNAGHATFSGRPVGDIMVGRAYS